MKDRKAGAFRCIRLWGRVEYGHDEDDNPVSVPCPGGVAVPGSHPSARRPTLLSAVKPGGNATLKTILDLPSSTLLFADAAAGKNFSRFSGIFL